MLLNTTNRRKEMHATTAKPKFQPGVLLATPGASEAFQRNGQMPFEFLKRHLAGDWGETMRRGPAGQRPGPH